MPVKAFDTLNKKKIADNSSLCAINQGSDSCIKHNYALQTYLTFIEGVLFKCYSDSLFN